MKTKQLLTTLSFMFFILSGTIAQEAVVTSGGNASGSNGTVSYSLGQVFYITTIGTNGNSVSEGVQQPYEIFVATSVPKAEDISLSAKVYPNPVNDLLMLKTGDFEEEGLLYQLFDINGKMLQEKKVTNTESQIIMSGLRPSTYFLKIIQTDKAAPKVLKVFKIIKK
jgi:hypothetical protein